jgi:hypothetical protein
MGRKKIFRRAVVSGKRIKYNWLDDYEGEWNEYDKEHVSKAVEEGYSQGELISEGADENGKEYYHRGWWRLA